MKRIFLLLTWCMLALLPGLAQVVTTEPTPLQEDSEDVVIYFHADEGSKGLINTPATTAIYAHTGVEVVDADGKTTQWKYAPSWEVNNEKFQLQYVSENLWKLYIGDIRTFYGVGEDETVTKLCFVFRNGNGSKTGKGEGETDIFVDVADSGFQLAFRKSITASIVNANSNPVKFTATATEEADIKIDINGTVIGEATNVKSLQASYKFENVGNYTITATATKNGVVRTQSIAIVFARASVAATDQTLPAMGLTKNADGSYTFCLAAPEKESAMIIGSWNSYTPDNNNVMDYVEQTIEGAPFRYFKITLPATVTGTEFGYYYLVDGSKSIADPYARLVLDPYNDKYISPEVYPDMPAYPDGLVPTNTFISWHGDNMLAYDWKVKNFKGAPKNDLVIYELLFRDFTGTEGRALGNGTVRLAMEKLPYLKELGINAIELLPINEFNGNLSWGYNPNYYFALDKAYGTPQDYKEFIDKCHELGIAVILDVVFNQADNHPWYQLYPSTSNPFFNRTAPHAYSVLNDWNQGYPLVRQQWYDMVRFWLSEYNVDGFRFDLVKGLGNNDSYLNASEDATNAYNASRVANMKAIHDAMREVNPDAYFINENLAGAKEENEMAADGELNWANVNNAGCQFAMGYSSSSNLQRMWALKDGRTAGSTVSYLESHDEQRLAYKQNQWGEVGVKGNHKVSMQRCGSAAAQMLMVPGSHMIWMFSEMGDAQNTKDANGGNNTSNKIVNWSLLDDPDNAGLARNYGELIRIRLDNPELFTDNGDYTLAFSSWKQRTAYTTAGDKELYLVVNPSITAPVTVQNVKFKKSDNTAYHIASCSFDSEPSFDAAAKTITVPANCYAVITTTNISGVEDVTYDSIEATRVYTDAGRIVVVNNAGPVEVYTLDGVLTATTSGDASISAAPGFYVVRAGGITSKVLVK
ncbi:MAG: hypothetical protein K2N88_01545 [Muribaculaceae bacterium]|nr:hypothetical protein [Muribaculaceae bacterium]